MAKVSTVTLNTADVDKYYANLRVAERFSFARVVKKYRFLSADRKASIAGRSLLNEISGLWSGFSTGQKEDWKDVSQKARKNGWQEFVKDQSIRIKADLAGVATPSALHQAWIGSVVMLEGAGEYALIQQHPNTYTVRQKVSGTKSMYSPVQVKEFFNLPYQLRVSYKTDLEIDGSEPFVAIGALVYSHYQGRVIETPVLVTPDYVEDWSEQTVNLTEVLGLPRDYVLLIYCKDVKGTLYIDNLRSIHNGQNWTRDWQFDRMEQGRTSKFYEVAKNWDIIIDSPLAFHGSGYLE